MDMVYENMNLVYQNINLCQNIKLEYTLSGNVFSVSKYGLGVSKYKLMSKY